MSNNPYRDLLRQAYQLAYDESTDTSTKHGAIIVTHDGRFLVGGVNSFTDSNQSLDSRNHERPRKYRVTEHAERAAIYKAARLGIQTVGLTMVCPVASCSDCARGIVLSGISTVIGHKQAYDKTPSRWQEEFILGFEILQGGGVAYHMFDGQVGDVENLFDREIWYP